MEVSQYKALEKLRSDFRNLMAMKATYDRIYDGFMDYVGSRVRNIREELGYSQEQLGTAMGVTNTYINKIENYKTEPSLDFLTKLLSVVADIYKKKEQDSNDDEQGVPFLHVG